MWEVLVVLLCFCCFFFKRKTASEFVLGDWSSDVCSSDLGLQLADEGADDGVDAEDQDVAAGAGGQFVGRAVAQALFDPGRQKQADQAKGQDDQQKDHAGEGNQIGRASWRERV